MKKRRIPTVEPVAVPVVDEPTSAVYATEADRAVPVTSARPATQGVTLLIHNAESNAVTVTTAQGFYMSGPDAHGEAYFVYQPADRPYEAAVGLSSVVSITILGQMPELFNEMPRAKGGTT